MTGRRASDWLKSPAIAGPSARDQRQGQSRWSNDDRTGQDRRAGDRRAQLRQIDTLFATSLINQVMPAAETLALNPYAAASTVRAGIWRTVKA